MGEAINYADRRQRFMETFAGDDLQSVQIPKVAAELMYSEFGVSIDDKSYIPLCWNVTWKHLMKFLHSQQAESFSVSTCGFTIEYMTDYSESDKARNIVPEMYHTSVPIFGRKHHNMTTGATFNQELISKYNEWRSVNMTETLDMIEREVFNDLITMYGVNLMVSATVMPLFAAIYAAGIQFAREQKKPVNMYNWFMITARDGDQIILTPLASIKQGLKDDAKK